MNELVRRLSEGEHPVEVSLRPEKTATALKESIDRGYVHIKFTNTQGGTDLGVRLDTEASNFHDADFGHQTGKVHLVGNLTLNYMKVRCIADINLATLEGKGHLEPVEQ
jgi:Core binding factor beta subunit